MIEVGLFGAGGAMGARVAEAVADRNGMRLAAAVGRRDDRSTLESCDVVIDFSVARATETLLDALGPETPLVTGTTGRDEAQQARLRARAERAPVFAAANFSVGVAVLSRLVRQAAEALADFDVEVVEIHHRRKLDAPSGTALHLGRAAADGRGLDWPAARIPAREGQTGGRPDGIGFAALRGGDVVGEHTVHFFGAAERLALSHVAADRRLFAIGAVRAAAWLVGRPAGLYGMADLIG